MKVIRLSQVPREPANVPLFTGGPVTTQPLVPRSMEGDLAINMVNFSKGAKTKWHTHTTDQVLVVTAGKGVVATEQEEQTVEAGDIVRFPAEEKHWHGATSDSDFSQISVLQAASKLTQLED